MQAFVEQRAQVLGSNGYSTGLGERTPAVQEGTTEVVRRVSKSGQTFGVIQGPQYLPILFWVFLIIVIVD